MSHILFTNVGATVDRRSVWRSLPREQQLLVALEAGKTLLDFGFTGAYSGGAADARWEVALRDEFRDGWLPGPRLKACSFERHASAVAGGTRSVPVVRASCSSTRRRSPPRLRLRMPMASG